MSAPAVELSVVTAAHNERENVAPLVEQIRQALDSTDWTYEILVVDDRSTDGTLETLCGLTEVHPPLRVITMTGTPRRSGEGLGQSAAFFAAIRAVRGGIIAMLDADLQNDPSDIPRLLETMRSEAADVVQGDRRAARQDGFVRSTTSAVGRFARRLLLGDTIGDTGCSLRVLRREVALQLPLGYRGMHRFIPVTCRRLGYKVVEQPVGHRARTAGKSKYGIRNRAWAGLIDCFGLRWMNDRRRVTTAEEVTAPSGGVAPPQRHREEKVN